MKANFGIYIILMTLMLGPRSLARTSDPSVVAEEARRPFVGQQESSTWTQVTNTVKSWWQTAKETLGIETEAERIVAREKTRKAKKQEKISELSEQMPKYRTADKGFQAKDIEQAKRALAPGLTRVVSEQKPAQSDLPKNAAGVPTFSLYETKNEKLKDGKQKTVRIPRQSIPRLNVGREARVSKNDFLISNFKYSLAQHQDPNPLKSPAMVPSTDLSRVTAMQVHPLSPTKEVDEMRKKIDKVVTEETVGKVQWKLAQAKPLDVKSYKPLSKEEQTMLTALLLYEGGKKCALAVGLFDQLAQGKELKEEASFHLGDCAHRLKLYSSSFAILAPLIKKENLEFAGDAIEILAGDLPPEFEVDFYRLIGRLKNKNLIPAKAESSTYYWAAKGAFKDSKYGDSKAMAARVVESHPKFAQAQYIEGVSEYLLGRHKTAISKLEGLRTWMAKKGVNDKNLNSLTALNLARIRFNTGDYKEALNLFMKVDKDHPTWVQALTEQGWAQLNLRDYAGAIGNMYSLHSPYFESVYKPESYAIRTIGYLNICQYGDAYKTLSKLEKDYRTWLEQTRAYISSHKLAADYYGTVVSYLRGKSTSDVDGLPYQVVREVARQKPYLNKQQAMNEKEDERGRHSSVNSQILKEKGSAQWHLSKALERFKAIEAKLKLSEKDSTLAKDINSLRAQHRNERASILGYRFKIALLEMSRKGFVGFKAKSEKRIAAEKKELRDAASKILARYMMRLQGNMSQILDSNEFLRYEVFAGSGENIRYQVSGGQVKNEPNRIPASMKPQKMMNWNFDGEYWEDEIGAYRSSLNNVCPSVGKRGGQGGTKTGKDDQARL